MSILDVAMVTSVLAFITYAGTVATGVTMIMTLPKAARDFDIAYIWRGITIAFWIPLVLFSQGPARTRQLTKLHYMHRDPLNYTGTWFTVVGGLILTGLMLLWIVDLAWQPMQPRTMITWAVAHTLCNVGKSVFHVKAIINNLEEESRECASTATQSQAV
jgi:hypothetical protein